MAGAIRKADELAAETKGAVVLGQFVNGANPRAHYETTGPEIWEDTGGQVDVFVAGVGTGGTITGTGRFPQGEKSGYPPCCGGAGGLPRPFRGRSRIDIRIGAGFVPEILDTDLYDAVIRVETREAYRAARMLAARQGLLTGITSGAALHAALLLAGQDRFAGKTIVALLPDTGERYLSTPLFEE